MAEEEKVPQEDSSSEETKKNKKKVIIGVCIVVALIVIFIIVLLLLLGSCTHRHTMIYHPAVEPTCDTPGSVQYWHCDECGNDYLDEKGHERIDDVTIDILPHIPVVDQGIPADCENDGLTEGSHCATCGEVIVAQEVIPALGHEIGTFTRVSNPTCTQTGLETSVCTRCGETIERIIPATGHTEEVILGTPATCTETGLSDGVRCSVCGAVLVAQEEISAKGHTYGETVVIEEASCLRDGKQESVCADCGETVTERIPALGHDRVYEPTIEATCETSGRTGRVVCDRCGMVLEEGETIPPLGHEIEGDECINCGKEACTDLEFRINDSGSPQYYVLTGLGDCTHTHILVPDWHTGAYGKLPVRSVGNYVFAAFDANNDPQDVGQIQSISFPDSITSIGAGAFQSCTNLINVTLGRSLERIGAGAFRGCTNLTSLHFLGSVSDWNACDEGSGYWTSVDGALLSDPEKAAELFRDTYSNYSWLRSGAGFGISYLS